jgi:thiamine-phosphate pyrophosphorylase
VKDARRLVGPDRPVGYSAHAVPEAATALAQGADYVFLSPIFPSASKPDLVPRGLPWLIEAAATLPPERMRALGGIETGTLPGLRETGIGGAAVMGAMMRSEDPFRTASELVAAWRGL